MSAKVIQQNLTTVFNRMKAAVERASRTKAPRLVAVSKKFPSESIAACYEAGQLHFGENYLGELETKAADLIAGCPDLKWHYIGRVQSNKIKKLCAIPNLWCVETIESQKHCELFQSQLAELNQTLNIFVQVNTSAETNKGGVEPKDLCSLVDHILQRCPNLNFKGLMTIGSIGESCNQEANADFELLAQLKTQLCERFRLEADNVELSMGMSNDFELAIKYGSSNVRVGSAIFGARQY